LGKLVVGELLMKHSGRIGAAVLLLSILFLVCACSRAGSPGYSAEYYEDSAQYASAGRSDLFLERTASRARSGFSPEGPAGNEGDAPPAYENPEQVRKLVKTAGLRIRVEDPAAMEKPVAELMQKYNAWPASAGIYENSREYTIRVPSPSYDSMLADLTGLGRVLRRTENAEDVTLRYYDLEGRLATKRELLKTYQGYLGRARNIEEIMTVESRIADLQQEIDQTGTRLRNLADLVDYSTINLTIAGTVSASSYSEPTLKEKLKRLFGSFGNVASSALVVLAGLVIYGVPAILVLILLFWILFGRIGLLKKLWRLAVKK
jgi:hypothetical protein